MVRCVGILVHRVMILVCFVGIRGMPRLGRPIDHLDCNTSDGPPHLRAIARASHLDEDSGLGLGRWGQPPTTSDRHLPGFSLTLGG